MTSTQPAEQWNDFIEPAKGFLSMPEFEGLERGYKLVVAAATGQLADATRSGTDIFEPLKACLRHKENNLLPWRLVDDLLKWAQERPGETAEAVSAIFDTTLEPYAALEAFLKRLPKDVVPGSGSRLATGSFFLMGRDPHHFPIYRQVVVHKVRKLARWEVNAENEIDEYRDTVKMFESFRAAANREAVPVESALHAQSLLYAIAQWEPDTDWPTQLQASVRKLRRERGMSDTLSLEKALSEYDPSKAEDHYRAASEQRELFVARFPMNRWNELSLEQYALGLEQSKEGVSYALEYVTTECGSIGGGTANKHLIYFSSARDKYKFETKYANESDAWNSIRSGVQELLQLVATSDFDGIDEIDGLWAAPTVRSKLAWLYFPDRLLPIYSEVHLDYWLSIFNVDAAKRGRVAKNRALFEALSEMPEFEGWKTLEIMHFLYSWTDPNPSTSIVKIAPGEGSALWEDCLANGYIRLGWDKTGDLSLFDSDDELRAEYEQRFPEDNKSTTTRNVRALRTFRDLSEGDIVVANKGTKKILGIGEVTGAYRFDPGFDEHRHVVDVKWFDTRERAVDFGSSWTSTVVPIKPDDYHRILRTSDEPSEAPTPLPSVPTLHLEAEKLLDRSGQVIFYGPPGTGKTYAARRHAAWLLGGGSSVPGAARAFGEPEELAAIEEDLLRAEQTDARPSWLIVANPSLWSFNELFERGREEFDFGRLKRNYEEVAVGDEVFGYEATPVKKVVAIAKVSRSLYTTPDGKQYIEIEPVDRPPKQVSLEMLKEDAVLSSAEPVSFGMQGTLFRLEPHEASRLRMLAELEEENASVNTGVAQLTRVTFHPTYAYEDFIEGYKPTESGAGGLELAMRDGVFKRVCRTAAADTDRPYVLMIDEINRGNVPKIFGELITLIEKDKRGMPLTLPQSGESFQVPSNVHIIATMNTADRSIHILDTALRRRFAFVELLPDPSILTAKVGPLSLDLFLTELNNRIRERIGREKQVGHAVLLPIATAPEFALSFKYELLPLLQEYTYGNYKDLAELLGAQVVDEENQIPRSDVIDDPERLVEALAKHLELG